MSQIIQDPDYAVWLRELKVKIKESQIRAALSVNSQLILLYWDLGRQIVEKQENVKWGAGFMNQLSMDLKRAFPKMSGFSVDNLQFMRRLFLFYNQQSSISAQAVQKLKKDDKTIKYAQPVQHLEEKDFLAMIVSIPWGHHTMILRKIKVLKEAIFYVSKTIENNWSRSVLEYQIETDLFARQGKAINNFKNSLPAIQSDLANEILKDPYNFEFLTLSERVKEKDLVEKLVQHISQFLLELGKGFAYMGRQFQFKVGRKDYRTDLLFYHTKLKCYIIIELKVNEFEPEYIGILNFYITAINELIKDDSDQPTIGILLCKNKDDFEVEFSLKDINKPIGVSEYHYKELPEIIQQNLPPLEDLTAELKNITMDDEDATH